MIPYTSPELIAHLIQRHPVTDEEEPSSTPGEPVPATGNSFKRFCARYSSSLAAVNGMLLRWFL